MIGTQRAQAVWRLLALLWTIPATLIGIMVFVPVGIVWGVVDIVGQLVTNRNVLDERGSAPMIVRAGLMWGPKNLAFAGTGEGRLYWIPQWGGDWDKITAR